jgi:general secretion pathway protein D
MRISSFLLLLIVYSSCILQCSTAPAGGDTADLITFQYDNEDLVNVVNYIAARKEVNLLLPTKSDEKLTGKLTWHLDKKVTIEQAWQLLHTILTIAGYTIIPRPMYYEIIKTSPGISRESVPLYIGTTPEQLPWSSERIRYIYYLVNIKQEGEAENEIMTVLKSLLPADAVFKFDSATNALIIMASAADIRAAMDIVTQLDRPGFQERMEIIKLTYTDARLVADLFNNKILQGSDTHRYRLDTKKPSDVAYFSKYVRIIANDKTNSLIVLGRTQALERIREFINHYIDVAPDSGKSILHVYQLQYLDAPVFAKVLNDIVQSKQMGGLEQSTAEKKAGTGPQRYFDEVIISIDTPADVISEAAAPSNTSATAPIPLGTEDTTVKPPKYYGGNKLIIACRNDDWERIRALIEKLDQPSPQVLIEVLIADLTLNDSRALGSLFRNPAKIPMPGQVNVQSAQLEPGVMPDSFSNPQTIGAIAGGTATDLLREFNNSNPRQDSGDPMTNVAALLQAGSTVLSFNDNSGKTWGITQILKVIDHTKILSHPHVISTNNQVATIEITEIRLLPADASGSQGGTIVQTNKQIPAALKVYIVPRISISDTRENTVSLNVTIDINEYVSPTNNTRITRKVKTNAIVNTGDILALGGLLRSNESDSLGETPLLSKMPVIGWFFKRRTRTQQRTNLTVFISPTIIEPRSREGLGQYTQDYLNITKGYAPNNLFDSLKDPVTRWFFNDESAAARFSREFMKHDEVHTNDFKLPVPKTSGTSRAAQTANSSAPSVALAHDQAQLAQLKNLLKDIDNPFKNMATTTANNNRAVVSEKKGRKRKR